MSPLCHMYTNYLPKRIKETPSIAHSIIRRVKRIKTTWCAVFRKIFDRKLKAREILFQDQEALSIMSVLSWTTIIAKVKGKYWWSLFKEKRGNDYKAGREPDLDQMAQGVQNLFKFKNFYDQMDFSSKQRLAITENVEKRTRRNNRFEGNAVVFCENGWRDV